MHDKEARNSVNRNSESSHSNGIYNAKTTDKCLPQSRKTILPWTCAILIRFIIQRFHNSKKGV